MKKLIFFMVLFFITMITTPICMKEVRAEVKTMSYVALGDSIAYGNSAAPGEGYVDLLYKYLKGIKGYDELKLINLGSRGDKTFDLLRKLQKDNNVRDNLRNANIITVSIGWNNFLGPIMKKIAEAFSIDAADPNFVVKLAVAVMRNPEAKKIIADTLQPQNISGELQEGAQQFLNDWPQITAAMKELSPNARIYVMTLYEPLEQGDPLYAELEKVIYKMNTAIQKGATGYNIVDVYKVFHEQQGASYVNFSPSKLMIDPHPTTQGHEAIFKAHVIPYEAVTIHGGKRELKVGSQTVLTAIVTPDAVFDKSVIWKSDNEKVLSIDDEGKAMAVSPGTAKITAMTMDGSKKSEYMIRVLPQDVPAVSKEKPTLPKTGSLLDANVLMVLGFMLLFGGLVVFLKKQKWSSQE